MKRNIFIILLIIWSSSFSQTEYKLDTIYNPAQGDVKNVALIYFGGSDGGMVHWKFASDSLPRMGYPTLAVKYHEKDKYRMVQIPIDSIYNMILHFKSRPEIKDKKLVLDGVSKGAELVLLLGSMFDEVNAVTALAPSHVAWEAIDFSQWQDKSTWSYKGKDIPYMPYDRKAFENSELSRLDGYIASLKDKDTKEAEIKVENTKGPILLFSGEADDSWPASDMGDKIMARLKEKNFPYRFEHYSYPDASHTLSSAEDASGTPEGNKKASDHYYKVYKEFFNDLHLQSTEREAILKTIDNLNQGWENRNVELAIQDYAEDVDWTNAFGDRVQGKDALRELLTTIFKLDFVMAGKQNYVENDIEFLSDDIALVRSKNLREEQQFSDGSQMGTRDINHLRVYKKIEGRWLIISHMISQAHQKR